jgi:hypothetical protein
MNTVQTPKGEVKLLTPPVELLRTIRSFLPFGALRYVPPKRGADFGLVMQCGEQELFAVKQQPVDCDDQQGKFSFQANSILIAHTLATYLKHGFSGLLMPCAYLRTKDAGRFEAGIAYFAYPSPHGREVQEYPYESSYDEQFGRGFFTMMTSFIHALEQSSRATRITLYRAISLDVRPRLQLGSLGFGFMVVGTHIVCLKTRISEQDPTWAVLRDTGISEVFHIPSVPASIAESALHTAKPNA